MVAAGEWVGPGGIGRTGRPMARYEAPEAAEGVEEGVDECPAAALEAARRGISIRPGCGSRATSAARST